MESKLVVAGSPLSRCATPQAAAPRLAPLTRLLAAGLSACIAAPALAADAEADVTELPPVVVTATKRDDDAQAVPSAITVLQERDLEQVPPTGSNAGVARATPNFSYVDYSAQFSNVGVIRGVGSFSPLSAEDTSVVFNVDEIPRSAYGMPVTMLDLQQVEVLRGPQGTLFGRNAQGGAVNFVTNAPSYDAQTLIRGEFGSHGHRLAEFMTNGSLVDDQLAGRIAAQYVKRGGDVPNAVTGGDEGQYELGSARGSLLYDMDAATQARLTVQYGKSDDNSSRFLLRDSPDYPVSGVNPENRFQRENYGANLRVDRRFDGFRATSVSSVQQDDLDQRTDLTDALVFSRVTGAPPAAFSVPGVDLMTYAMRDRTYFQELRLSSLEDSTVSWVGGVNYFRSEFTGRQNGNRFSIPSYAIFSGDQDNALTTDSYSAFGEATVPVAGALKATAGLRATRETKDVLYRYTGNGTTGTVPSHRQSESLDDDLLTGRVALSYDWSPRLMSYVSAGRGAVAGGLPWSSTAGPVGKDMPSYPKSTSWTYEAGFKSQAAQGRLNLSGSVFYNDVKDGHLLVVDPRTFAFSTAALDYDSYGGELEAQLRIARGLSLFGGAGYTRARLGSVPAGSLTGASTDNKVPNVPEWTANIGAEERFAGTHVGIPLGDVFVSATYQFVDKRAADIRNSFDLDAYGITNARAGWDFQRTSLYLFAYNLFNDRYEAVGNYYGPSALTVRPGPGRIVGIGTTIAF